MKQRLNFSPKPFSGNRSPMALFWLINAVLFIGLIISVLYLLQLRQNNQSSHTRIAALKDSQRQVARDHQRSIGQLEAIDMPIYTKTIRQFHQIQVAYQTHWGQLLDELGQLLPQDVRITTLAPTASSGASRERDIRTTISLGAEARNKQAQLDFIRALQERANYQDVRFESEEYDDSGRIAFEIRFTHHPGGAR